MTTDPKTRTRAAFPATGEILDDRYEITGVLGEGGMGVVLKARDLRVGRDVAIKMMHAHLAKDTDFSQRFQREISIARRLDHPHTVRLYDLGTTAEGAMFLVMELVAGDQLNELFREQPLSLGRVVDLTQQLLDGLAEAHALGIVHRDLKPGNIMVGQDRRGDDRVKILDFGIAKSLVESTNDITKTGSVVGTGAYLAPELFLAGDCTFAADVYAVGLLMMQMLCGKRVIDAPTLGQMIHRHLYQPLVFPPSLHHSDLESILKRALAKSPEDRFDDAEAMLQALQKIDINTPDQRLHREEIIQIFAEMDRRFAAHSKNLLKPNPSPDSTIVLDDADLQMLDSETQIPVPPDTAQVQPKHLQQTPQPELPAVRSQSPVPPPSPTKPRQSTPKWVYILATSVAATVILALVSAALMTDNPQPTPDETTPSQPADPPDLNQATPPTIAEQNAQNAQDQQKEPDEQNEHSEAKVPRDSDSLSGAENESNDRASTRYESATAEPRPAPDSPRETRQLESAEASAPQPSEQADREAETQVAPQRAPPPREASDLPDEPAPQPEAGSGDIFDSIVDDAFAD